MSEYQTELEFLNDEAMIRAMETLHEVESLNMARDMSEPIAKALAKNAGIPKSKIKYVGMEIKYKNQPYIAMGVLLNNAVVLIRATDPVNNRYYVPETFYAVMSYMNGDQEVSKVIAVAGLNPPELGDPGDDFAVVGADPIPIDWGHHDKSEKKLKANGGTKIKVSTAKQKAKK